jgi:hypothetical protein
MNYRAFATAVLTVVLTAAAGCSSGPAKPDQAVDRPRPDWPIWSVDVKPPPVLDGPPHSDRDRTGVSDKAGTDKAVCACKPTEGCMRGGCYNKCATFAPCYADSTCDSLQACVEMQDTKEELCVPAPAAPGAPCDNTERYCRNNFVCAFLGRATTGTCAAVCSNPGGKCADGKDCYKDIFGCSYCDPFN